MKVPQNVRSLLSLQKGTFKGVLDCDAPESSRVVSQLVKCKGSFLLLITLGGTCADIDKIAKSLRSPVTEASLADVIQRLEHSDLESIVPIPRLYNLKAIIDPAVLKLNDLYLASGAKGVWIKSSKQDYIQLLKGSVKVASISAGSVLMRKQILNRVKSVDKLPTMPGIAAQILKIKNNPYATSAELVAVVAQDPPLTAQLLRYANSEFYGVRAEVVDLEDAVDQVLGFDFVLDLAFGLALGQPLKIEKSGLLGLQSYWRKALAIASVVQALIETIDYSSRPSSSMGYLAALLHDIGLLFLGHNFPEQYELINRVMTENPDRNLLELEEDFLGTTHIELGEKVMKAWDMPHEILEVIAHHHEYDYRSETGSRFANIVYIAEQGLQHYYNDEVIDIPQSLLRYVGVKSDDLRAIIHNVMDDKGAIYDMARKMVA